MPIRRQLYYFRRSGSFIEGQLEIVKRRRNSNNKLSIYYNHTSIGVLKLIQTASWQLQSLNYCTSRLKQSTTTGMGGMARPTRI